MEEEKRGTRREERRGERRDKKEGAKRRKKQGGGSSDVEEGATRRVKKMKISFFQMKKKWLEDASLTPVVLFPY